MGQFKLGEANFYNATVVASPAYAELDRRLLQRDPIFFVRYLAGLERKVHLVRLARPLPDGSDGILVEQVHAVEGEESCVQLTARQGQAIWRKTIKRPLAVVDQRGRSPSLSLANAIHLDAKALQIDLARHLGIKVPKEMADPYSPARSSKSRSITIQ